MMPSIQQVNVSSAPELADQIDAFIENVGQYLEWDKAVALHAAGLHEAREAARRDGFRLVHHKTDRDKLIETESHRLAAAAVIRQTGPALAEVLERHGLDSQAVLASVHCAGVSGGGANALWPIWPQRKIELQRYAITLRQGGMNPRPVKTSNRRG